MLRSVFSAAVMMCLLAGPGLAADAPDSHLAAAIDIIEATNAKANLLVMIDTMGDTMIAQVRQSHPGASEKALTAFRAAFKDEMRAATDDLMKMQAAVYAEHFSESDLHALAAFYRSDVGKRFISEQPAIIKEITPLALKWGMDTGKNAAQKALDKLQKEGITL